MRSRQEKIVVDLLNIFLKYDANEIAEALQLLQSGEAFHQFVELGRETSKLSGNELPASLKRRVSLPSRKRNNRSKRALLDEFIATLFSSENRLHKEIAAVLKAASKRETLASTSVLQKLFLSIGLPVSEHSDRLSMIYTLGKHLVKLQPEEIESIIQLSRDASKQESSLQRWTDIIVQKGRSGRG
jgi:hypothetical protein